MKKRIFLQNIIILSLSSLLIRGLGMIFTVRLAAVMGAEMLGRYRLIISIYVFFLLLCTSGISVTVTRLTGDLLAKNEFGKAAFVRDKALQLSLITGVIIGLIMIGVSFILPKQIFGEGASSAVRLLGISLPFGGFSAALRGYFTAKRKILRNCGEQLLEQLSEIIIFFSIAGNLSKLGISPLLCAAFSTTSAEIISFIYCIILWYYDKKCNYKAERFIGIYKIAMPIFIPCTASAGLRSALSTVENSLIPVGLMTFGAEREAALSEYGIISGMALPCVLLPSVFILPFSQLIVTELSRERTLMHKKNIRRIAVKSLKIVIIYSLIMMLPYLIIPDKIASSLGYCREAGFYMRVLAPLIPLSFLDSAVDGMLKGLDCQKSYFRINIIESVLRVIMALTLVPILGSAGVIAIIIFGELINVTLSLWKLLDIIKKK